MSHSPAPWSFTPSQRSDRHVLEIVDADENDIVITDSGYYPPTIDDARLITAAPDLLAALKAASAELLLFPNSPLRLQIDAALAKAEGQ